MIKIDDVRFEVDLAKIISDIKTSKNKDLILQNYDSLDLLKDLILDNYDLDIEIDLPIIEKICDEEYRKAQYDFVKRIDKFSKSLSNISNNFVDKMDEIGFSCIEKSVSKVYSEKEFKDIILSYFSTYGNDIYKIANNYFEEGRIEIGVKTRNLSDAYYVGFQSIKNGYIFCKLSRLDSLTASYIVHELGHAVDAHKYLFNKTKYYPCVSDCLHEVVSSTYEYTFYDFLKENNIDVEGYRILDNNMIDELRIRMESIKEFFQVYKGKIKTNDPFMDVNKIEDCSDDFYYGLADYLFLHLRYIRSKDHKEYLDSLDKLITLRHRLSLEKMINRIGFSIEDFVSGKYINDRIENDYMELKKRYK